MKLEFLEIDFSSVSQMCLNFLAGKHNRHLGTRHSFPAVNSWESKSDSIPSFNSFLFHLFLELLVGIGGGNQFSPSHCAYVFVISVKL